MSSDQNYYKELSELSRLTEVEIQAEARKLKLGDTKALDRIVEANLRLVVHIAKKYQNAIELVEIFELGDLISEGNIGLIQAARKYDPERGIHFGYYASFAIQSKIIDFITDNQSTIRSPYNKIKTDSKIRKKVDELFQELNEEIGEEQIRNLRIFTEDEIDHFFNKARIVVNDSYIEIEEDTEKLEFQSEQIKKLKLAMNMLKPNHRKVIKSYFGIDCDRMSMPQIALEMGLSKARIGQIKTLALKKMNKILDK